MNPRTILTSTVLLLVVAATAGAAPLVNQIDDGGLEKFENSDPVEWRVVEGEVNPTSDAAEGDSAAVLSLPGDTLKSTVAQNVSLEREDAPVLPAQEYELDFQALLDIGEDTTSTDVAKAQAVIIWKNALGETSRVDVVPIAENTTYESYEVTKRAPEDATEAEVQFTLERVDLTDRTDANLKVDAVAFGPTV